MKVQGCCTFPHGHLSIYMFITAISAFLFALSASFSCYFLDINASFSSREGSGGELILNNPITDESVSSTVGLFMYEDGYKSGDDKFNWVCYVYDDEQVDFLDSNFKTARFMGAVAIGVLGISMILLALTCCVQYQSFALKLAGILMIVGGFCQCATFIIFQSDLCSDPFECKFYLSAGICIAAVLTAWATGVLAMLLPPSVEPFTSEDGGPAREPFEPGTVTETETIMPDGTTKITRTTVNPDGSKTIEETVYDPPAADADQEQFEDDEYTGPV